MCLFSAVRQLNVFFLCTILVIRPQLVASIRRNAAARTHTHTGAFLAAAVWRGQRGGHICMGGGFRMT